MMTLQEAIAKATKLIKLSASDNPAEAALAAQRAQEILARYDIDMASLAMDAPSSEPDEAIEDFTSRSPLDQGNARMARWKLMLASRIARANQCRAYQSGATIGIIGRASDVEKVRYLYAMLVREVDRLTERDGKGCGMNYRTEYRIGAVSAIGDKLAEAKAKVAQEMRAENSGAALVRVNNALETIAKKEMAVDQWVQKNMRFHSKTTYSRPNHSAREAGYAAGKSLNIGGSKGSIGQGQKRLK
jgi:type II secretory pathway component GspD/PulD (secretin)